MGRRVTDEESCEGEVEIELREADGEELRDEGMR